MTKLFILFMLAVGGLFAQEEQPNYFVNVGASYNYYERTPAGLIDAGRKVADKTYLIGSLDLFSRSSHTAAAVRTGLARVLAEKDHITLLGLGDAGVLRDDSVTLGDFSGGGALSYDLEYLTKKLPFVLTVSVRILDITSKQVKPVWAFTLGKTF